MVKEKCDICAARVVFEIFLCGQKVWPRPDQTLSIGRWGGGSASSGFPTSSLFQADRLTTAGGR